MIAYPSADEYRSFLGHVPAVCVPFLQPDASEVEVTSAAQNVCDSLPNVHFTRLSFDVGSGTHHLDDLWSKIPPKERSIQRGCFIGDFRHIRGLDRPSTTTPRNRCRVVDSEISCAVHDGKRLWWLHPSRSYARGQFCWSTLSVHQPVSLRLTAIFRRLPCPHNRWSHAILNVTPCLNAVSWRTRYEMMTIRGKVSIPYKIVRVVCFSPTLTCSQCRSSMNDRRCHEGHEPGDRALPGTGKMKMYSSKRRSSRPR
jgi:hypothetical protein